MTLFHLAFRVDDIASTRRFYAGQLGCRQGREAANWIDFDFYGHQIPPISGRGRPRCR